jgi:hypothetical protein
MHARYGPSDHEPLDLGGAFEDGVALMPNPLTWASVPWWRTNDRVCPRMARVRAPCRCRGVAHLRAPPPLSRTVGDMDGDAHQPPAAAPPRDRAWTQADVAAFLVCAESTVEDIRREDTSFPTPKRPRPGLARWVPADVVAWFEGLGADRPTPRPTRTAAVASGVLPTAVPRAVPRASRGERRHG